MILTGFNPMNPPDPPTLSGPRTRTTDQLITPRNKHGPDVDVSLPSGPQSSIPVPAFIRVLTGEMAPPRRDSRFQSGEAGQAHRPLAAEAGCLGAGWLVLGRDATDACWICRAQLRLQNHSPAHCRKTDQSQLCTRSALLSHWTAGLSVRISTR